VRYIVTGIKYMILKYEMIRIIRKNNLEEFNVVEGEWFKLK
jgi:hypothetical protein